MTIPTLKRLIVFEPNTNIYLTQYVSITPKSDNICIYIHIYYTSYICMYIYIMKDEYTYARTHLYILIYIQIHDILVTTIYLIGNFSYGSYC